MDIDITLIVIACIAFTVLVMSVLKWLWSTWFEFTSEELEILNRRYERESEPYVIEKASKGLRTGRRVTASSELSETYSDLRELEEDERKGK